MAEIEDYCANEPINIENLKLLSYGRSAIKALELAVDSADRTLFFGSKIEQEKRYSSPAATTRSAEKYDTPIFFIKTRYDDFSCDQFLILAFLWTRIQSRHHLRTRKTMLTMRTRQYGNQ